MSEDLEFIIYRREKKLFTDILQKIGGIVDKCSKGVKHNWLKGDTFENAIDNKTESILVTEGTETNNNDKDEVEQTIVFII